MAKEIKETAEQLNIVNSTADIKRIIACAGSGKTWVITSSIIKILKAVSYTHLTLPTN